MVSSSKNGSPTGRCSINNASRSSRLACCIAETRITSFAGKSSTALRRISSSVVAFTRSVLVNAIHTGGSFRSCPSFSAIRRSSAVKGSLASSSHRMISASRSASLAAWFIKSPSLCCGLCSPGVSTNTTWAAGRVRIPSWFLRVVCGFGETAAIFWVSRALISVDLPTLGRPITAT